MHAILGDFVSVQRSPIDSFSIAPAHSEIMREDQNNLLSFSTEIGEWGSFSARGDWVESLCEVQ